MRPKALDPILLHLAQLAGVRPPHCFHLLHTLAEQKGRFNANAYATFASIDIKHVAKMLEVFEAEGLCDPVQAATAGPRGTRLPPDYIMPPENLLWAQTERLWAREIAETEATIFADYWHAQPGQKGVKVDWAATWRNWVRNSRRANGERVVEKTERDPAEWVQYCKGQIEHWSRMRDTMRVRDWRRALEAAEVKLTASA